MPLERIIQYPLYTIGIGAGLYLLLHFLVVKRKSEPRSKVPARPSTWAIRPGGEAVGDPIDPAAYGVVLEAVGDEPIHVLKVIRELSGLGLKEAKELLDDAPRTVTTCTDREEAERQADALRREGARVSVVGPEGRRSGPAEPYEVMLEHAGDHPIHTIRLVRQVSRLGLKESKDLVDGAPKRVKVVQSRREAEALRQTLEAEGASVTLS